MMKLESMDIQPGDLITIDDEGTFRVEGYHEIDGCQAIKLIEVGEETAQQLQIEPK
jgi:hypothetical protein